jgi:putative ABC transport system permease protein
MRTPLAWRNLVHSKARMAASVGGVAFAVVLMFLEMGFRNGLYDSQTYVVQTLDADLLIVHAHKEAVVPKVPFARARLFQAKAHPDVAAAYPLYLEELKASWRSAVTKKDYPILVFGVEPDDPVFRIDEVRRQSALLKVPDTALLDSRGKDFYGPRQAGAEAELSRRAVKVVGTFPLGPDFRVDGNVIVGARTFFKLFGAPAPGAAADDRVAGRVEFGLLKLRPGADPAAVRSDLQARLGADVSVLTPEEFNGRVRAFWGASKPVGYVFGLGTAVGFLIGVVICYQILYNDITDNLPQYATLKAMGYSDAFLVKVVLQEAVFLAVLGFVPGLLLSLGAYSLLQQTSGILMRLTPARAALVFFLALAMCTLSAPIAIRKAVRSDPAELY